ncbi:MAG: bifunctional ornithine acetyltransferase/N-acetylglutamate synthase [Rickettsiales bacterium]|nr:bifunctional ornithine acetyltransferase/N-acetylglutamate synthase [Rickettsiales bacterium]OUT45304.1 MAG: bifunctional ornithine acetyltransferase/N-acetylglutamate synthase [Pelagibacteraceae bacterium TMED13]
MKNKSPLAPKKNKNLYLFKGISVSSTHCGLKKNKRLDLVLIKLEEPGSILGSFTKSKTPGEPIIWNKSIVKNKKVSAILINSGNANVFTGLAGKKAILDILNKLSRSLNVPKNEIYLASTGVIGEPLDSKKIIKKIPVLIKSLQNDKLAWSEAADAITTTDTYSKYHSETVSTKDSLFINGIAKGSGMIQPNMATMLGFIFTNFDILSKKIETEFKEIINKTFNSISVDGDTSTSDMVLLFSVKNKTKTIKTKKLQEKFLEKLEILMTTLSHLIVKDGEGASKFITVEVIKAKNDKDARKVARSIINSPLIKTAMAGSDSNWGRIIMAIGKTDAEIFPEKISLSFGKYLILDQGNKFISKNVSKINKYLKTNEIKINISLGLGRGSSKMWTCDLTKEYISINADYRS